MQRFLLLVGRKTKMESIKMNIEMKNNKIKRKNEIDAVWYDFLLYFPKTYMERCETSVSSRISTEKRIKIYYLSSAYMFGELYQSLGLANGKSKMQFSVFIGKIAIFIVSAELEWRMQRKVSRIDIIQADIDVDRNHNRLDSSPKLS
jgi:hypothetical protein